MTHEELKNFFADTKYDMRRRHIQKVLNECADVDDPRVVRIASSYMLEAEEEGVELSPADGVRLARAFKPTPIKDLVAGLERVGVKTLDDLGRILEQGDKEPEELFTGGSSKSAKEKAEKLEDYAEALTCNPDIILLGRPMLWPEIDSAWLKLAVLCDELAEDEQILLTAMRDVADRCEFKVKDGIPMVIFDIKNVHEK